MTIDDAIALGRETLALEAAKTAAAQHDDAQHERLAEGFRQHCRTAAPTLAAALVALGPALVEWREAHAAVAAVGPAYRAAERSGDPDAHFAASIALDDAKHRREASNRALAAALDTLNAAPAAGKG